MQAHTASMLYAFGLISLGVYMFTTFSTPQVEIIYYILSGVMMLVLNTNINYKVKNPYYFITVVSTLITGYVGIRAYSYLSEDYLPWYGLLGVLFILGVFVCTVLVINRPKSIN